MNKPVNELRDRILSTKRRGLRRIVAIAGAPASGKSTLAEVVVTSLNEAGCRSLLVPMDGFHLDNAILEPRGLLARKGAPETFDVGGLLNLAQQLGGAEALYFPIFDRSRDLAVAGAGYIGPDSDTIVVEGNYLLMDAPVWRELAKSWDLTVFIQSSTKQLEERLVQRWLDHGLSRQDAKMRVDINDLPNAKRVQDTAIAADMIW